MKGNQNNEEPTGKKNDHLQFVIYQVINEMMGHFNLKTTERYTHLTSLAMRKLKSPLDHFDFEGTERTNTNDPAP
jgi:hypothetical protein